MYLHLEMLTLVVKNTVYLKVAKKVDLKISYHKKTKSYYVGWWMLTKFTVVIISQYIHKSLCCTPTINKHYISIIFQFKVKKGKKKRH